MPTGKAEIIIEGDGQYSTIVFIDEVIQPNPSANQTLTNAFNGARDTLAALPTGGQVFKRVRIVAHYE